MTNHRYDRLKEQMRRNHLDAVVAVSQENTYYMTGAYIETQKSLRRLALTLFPLEGEPVLIGCIIEQNTITAETWIADKRFYVEFQDEPMHMLADAIEEKGLAKGTIGMELDCLDALNYQTFMNRMPGIRLVPCAEYFERVRTIKDENEIALLTRAANATRIAFEKAIEETHPGETERMLGIRTHKNMLDLGCEKVDFLMLGSGKRSTLVHAAPDDSILLDGEEGRIDVGGFFGNYCSDVARTFVIGNAPAKHEDLYKKMVEVYVAAIECCRIGTPVNKPWQVAKAKSEALGLPFNRVHEGHGLGIACHEKPMLQPKNTEVFEKDMLLNVEHAMHVDGYRYHVEDLVRITENGPVILSETDFNPHLLHIR